MIAPTTKLRGLVRRHSSGRRRASLAHIVSRLTCARISSRIASASAWPRPGSETEALCVARGVQHQRGEAVAALDRALVDVDVLDPAERHHGVRAEQQPAHHAQPVGAHLVAARLVAPQRHADDQPQRHQQDRHEERAARQLAGEFEDQRDDDERQRRDQRAEPHDLDVVRMERRERVPVVIGVSMVR